MGKLDSGVAGYVVTEARVRVCFPISWRGSKEIACKHCNFFVRATQRCGLTQQVVNFPEKYVGECCPLEIIEENKEQENV